MEQLQVLDRLDQLIRLKATGNYQDLANRLGISYRNVYNFNCFDSEVNKSEIFFFREAALAKNLQVPPLYLNIS